MVARPQILSPTRWKYLFRGVSQRFIQPKRCPCCASGASARVDRKLCYTLERCERCGLLFRFPQETEDQMRAFYQGDYSQPGLTTDLPSDIELRRLMAGRFTGTVKDFSRVIRLLRALGLGEGARVLDYGANWGYATFQLRAAGFHAEAFEISEVRAAFGRKLGVLIHTCLEEIDGLFDTVYSGHVLEHVANPLLALREQLARVRSGGFVVAHTPNGSAERWQRSFPGFHRNWGQVHPVLLTGEFVARSFAQHPVWISTHDDERELIAWDQRRRWTGDLSGEELLFIIRQTSPAARP